ncbi:MAG: hypothetical protein UT39_C0012G0013 [Candidatus Woesebacteria bacterium GW2011_GWA1_39_21]|uniref:Transglycosylase SLT domain-containing protein n=1 Tax=Candidatus Woesebacteria bacterium GW2011_GWA1_39_21 TaxID=1618550 RepID=A0A0G0NDU4_9BACT|nr:MAG: hypothetical protein UT39_C0012G0013 [Candidatus Woesebacteria bacterium GW2011_GWA1_39_21]
MKKIAILIITPLLCFYAGYRAAERIFHQNKDDNVLSLSIQNLGTSPTSTEAPKPSPIESPTTTPPPSPTAIPTKIPTTTPIPQPKVSSEEIQGFMERFSGQYGIDVNVLRYVAVCESGFNPSAINGPYAGLFQFNTSTWKNNRLPMGEDPNPDLRLNAEEATQTAAYLISIGKFYLWPNCYP